MCGIIGQFTWGDGNKTILLTPSLLNLLTHRGPDEGAYWEDDAFFLGHRRLSIIDISLGGQPMATGDGRYVIVFNGEIYNYIELRKILKEKGYVFQTDSDTEVLLNGYLEWKTDLPSKLIGMFAFSIADRREKSLFLARDRFGEKPLFVFEGMDQVIFSSEVKLFSALGGFQRSLDENALLSYLCLNYVAGSDTLLKGVKRLPPASWRLYSKNGITQGEYWSVPRGTHPFVSEQDAMEKLEELLDKSVNLTLRSDVPVGIFLSGGIDSSLVAESAARQGRLTMAYCLDFQEKSYSELDKATFVSKKLGIPLKRVVLDSKAMDHFMAVVEHADDPLADSSALAVWTLAREASKHHKVVLGGDGADELFAGYLTYKATDLHKKWVSRLPLFLKLLFKNSASIFPTLETKVSLSYKIARFLRASDLTSAQAHLSWNGTWLPSQFVPFLKSSYLQEKGGQIFQTLLDSHSIPSRPTLQELQYLDSREYLPNDILSKVDRMTMAHGVEVRAPFLHPEMASFAACLPDSLKISPRGELKSILRRMAKKKLGDSIAHAGKQGFSIPVHEWVRRFGKNHVEDLLGRQSLEKLSVFNIPVVEKAINEHMSGKKSYGYEIWGLMILSAWHRVRIQNTPEVVQGGNLIQRKFEKQVI